MVYVTVCLNVNEGIDFEEAYQATKEIEARTNQEEGCIYFHVYPLDREKRQIMMWEIWQDQASIEANHETPYVKAFFAKKLVRPEFGFESTVD